MSFPLGHWRTARFGLFPALLALAVQIMTGGITAGEMAWRARFADPAASVPICHTEGPADSQPLAPGSDHRRAGDCVLCCVWHVAGHASAVLRAPAPLPAPRLVLVARAAPLPPARAPPTPAVVHTSPRGPPLPA